MTAYDAHWEDLLDDCDLAGLSHSVGVHVHGFDESRRGQSARALNLSLQPGDMYVINANRLHAVPTVIGPRDRITLQSFLGYSASELLIWA